VKVLVLSSTFPNPRQPALGVFVRERIRRVARACEVTVVAPVPWFPFNDVVRRGRWRGVPRVEQQGELTVYHPRVVSVPGVLKSLDGVLYAASLVPFLIRLRRRFDFDLIDAHFAYPDGLAGVLLGKWFGRPTTITLRGSIVRLSRSRLHRPQMAWALRHAAGVMAVSESLKRVAVGLGIRADRIRVIPNGVDTDKFRPADKAATRQALGIPATANVILTVAGIYDQKGQHLVVETLPALAAEFPDLLYIVVGQSRSSADIDRLQQSAARLGVAPQIRIIGPQRHEEVPRWFAAADIFCLATATEGWANVLLESLACGVPVVTTSVGGNPEIIRRPSLGTLVPWNDVPALREALRHALRAPWDRDELIAHARAHSWEASADAVLQEFRRIVPAGEPIGARAAAGLSAGG